LNKPESTICMSGRNCSNQRKRRARGSRRAC
jgi:hypothetical protein